MAILKVVPAEEVARSIRSKREPSARTERSQRIVQDAAEIIEAVHSGQGAVIDVSDEAQPNRYLAGLRSAIARAGASDIALVKRRGRAEVVARQASEADLAVRERRQAHGAELGKQQAERAQARKATKPPVNGNGRAKAVGKRAAAPGLSELVKV